MIARGKLVSAQAARLEAEIPGVACGDGVTILTSLGPLHGTVTESYGKRIAIVPGSDPRGTRPGDIVEKAPQCCTRLGVSLLGRAVDALGSPLDERAVEQTRKPFVAPSAPLPNERREVGEPFWTGIRAIDALLTIGRGARVGIFGAPGLGKSTLLEMLAAYCNADAVVIALIGERGREAERWLARVRSNATVVCATSDTSSYERINAAQFAMAQACALRAAGLHVLLVVDSLARYAAALREARIACGEPGGRAGYPATVFHELARFVECAGATRHGSITMIATVLSDGDERDPVSDAARSLLDGHIQLSAALANAGRFPAIDVSASASRTMRSVTDAAHRAQAATIRNALATLASCADARAAGLMPAEPCALRAIAAEPALETFLRQAHLAVPPAAALAEFAALADTFEEAPWTLPPTSPP